MKSRTASEATSGVFGNYRKDLLVIGRGQSVFLVAGINLLGLMLLNLMM